MTTQTSVLTTSNGSDRNLRKMPLIVNKIAAKQTLGEPFFSFEYFPPKTQGGVSNLYERVARMALVEPLFVDVTWGAGGTTSDLTLDLSGNLQEYLGVDCMMHLTCTNMPEGKVVEGLETAKKRGIRNILALRGDPPLGQEWQACADGFEHATDLVRFIRSNYGDYFGICVAGYPEGHPSGYLDGKMTYEEEMQHLKEKMDAGADFIITQMFYDVDCFLKFVKDCRDIGINCPVIPGILPIQNYNGFKKMTGFCKTRIPPNVNEAIEAIKDDDSAVKEFGIRLGVDMCNRILKSGAVPGIHFYSLNLEKSVLAIVDRLDLVPRAEAIRSLPWRPATTDKRRSEDVRPIFWANRPCSYLGRTSGWDDYPNGRWGDSRSPAYGDLSDHHLVGGAGWKSAAYRKAAAENLGEVSDFDDIKNVFVRFQRGEIKRLPWSESDELKRETSIISEQLEWLNRSGLLTINSQPRVNGVPSTDPALGWGSKGGFVYQKAYVEFFAKRSVVDALFDVIERGLAPSLTVHAADAKSDKLRRNVREDTTCAVTWGVFPDCEIIQPTVVDAQSFLAWKTEAFGVWTDVWGRLYEEGSKSVELLAQMKDELMLVNVVDNNFVNGDIFEVFKSVLPCANGTS